MKCAAISVIGKRCTGCEACVQACPQCALTMEPDEEGFFYPVLQERLCTHCGICAAICPVVSPERVKRTSLPDTILAGTLGDREVLRSSASGGAFSAIVSAAGPDVVYGTAWTGPAAAACIRVTPEAIGPLRSSKYVQGRVHSAYAAVRRDLKEGKNVLFSGTPCQAAGLIGFLGNCPERLTTVEILCHGTASPGLFQEYLRLLGEKANSPVRSFAFRKKDPILGNWEACRREVRFENGRVERTYQDLFTELFLSRTILRPVCGECPFASSKRVSDIVIGDYWGCAKNDPGLYNKAGVSIILPMTGHGREIASMLAAHMALSPIPTTHVTKKNSMLLRPKAANSLREAFFETVLRDGAAAAFAAFAPKSSWKQPIKPYLRLLGYLRG